MEKTAYVVFIEDKTYLLWQLELFLYSITRRAKVPEQDIFLFWSCPEYYSHLDKTQDPAKVERSEWLNGIIQAYPSMKHYYSQNFGRQNRAFRFLGEGKGFYGVGYPGINKWSSWIEYANGGCFKDYDEVFILEQDLWFSDEIPEMPKGNCVSYNWVPRRKESFYKTDNPEQEMDEWAKVRGFTSWEHEGWDLDDIMTLTKVSKKKQSLWKQGAVLFKFRSEDLKPKFLNDLMNYQYLLLHLGEIAHPVGKLHETDMIAPGLACCNNNIDLTVIHDKQFLTETWCKAETYYDGKNLPKGTIVHYGWPFSSYPHFSKTDELLEFSKTKHGSNSAPWEAHRDIIKKDLTKSKFQWLINFYQDMLSIKESYPSINRVNNKKISHIRI